MHDDLASVQVAGAIRVGAAGWQLLNNDHQADLLQHLSKFCECSDKQIYIQTIAVPSM